MLKKAFLLSGYFCSIALHGASGATSKQIDLSVAQIIIEFENLMSASDFKPTPERIAMVEKVATRSSTGSSAISKELRELFPTTVLGWFASCAYSPNALAFAQAYVEQKKPITSAELDDAQKQFKRATTVIKKISPMFDTAFEHLPDTSDSNALKVLLHPFQYYADNFAVFLKTLEEQSTDSALKN